MKNFRFLILITSILIVCLGLLSIYSTVYNRSIRIWKLQIFWVIIGLFIFLFFERFNYRHLWDAAYFLYVLAIFLLLLVFLLGIVRLGAQRWLRIAWFNFQPSEIVKLIMVIFLARYFSTKSYENISFSFVKRSMWQAVILPFLFVAIPMGFIIEQPDLGSGVMLLFIFIAFLYISRVRKKYIIIFLGVMILLVPLFWHFLRDYQKERLLVFLNPNIDPLGAGYTVIQAKIAIGSGGLFGKGWLSGTQSQLRFLPEAHTDFIFSAFAEEWGFFGCIVLLFLYYFLITQSIRVALKTQDNFGQLLAWGISFLLGIQIFINLAMNLGLAPVVGLPLPLMSYGGSSIVTTFIALGILASIDKRRTKF